MKSTQFMSSGISPRTKQVLYYASTLLLYCVAGVSGVMGFGGLIAGAVAGQAAAGAGLGMLKGAGLCLVAIASGWTGYHADMKAWEAVHSPARVTTPRVYKAAQKAPRLQPLGHKFGAVALTPQEAADLLERSLPRAIVLQEGLKVGRPVKLKNHLNRMENS